MKWKRLISTLMAGCMLFANTAVTITADAANDFHRNRKQYLHLGQQKKRRIMPQRIPLI